MSIRFTDELGECLRISADIDDRTMVEVVRIAVEKYLNERRQQPDYKAKLAARIKQLKG